MKTKLLAESTTIILKLILIFLVVHGCVSTRESCLYKYILFGVSNVLVEKNVLKVSGTVTVAASANLSIWKKISRFV